MDNELKETPPEPKKELKVTIPATKQEHKEAIPVIKQEYKKTIPEKKQELSRFQRAKSTTSNVFNFIKAGVWNGISDIKEENDIWAKIAFAETLEAMCLCTGISFPPVLVVAVALTGVKPIYEGTCAVGYYAYSGMRDCVFKNQKKEGDHESGEFQEKISVKP